MSLVFLPEREQFFAWGVEAHAGFWESRQPARAPFATSLVLPERRRVVSGVTLSLLDTVECLGTLREEDLRDVPGSVAVWARASQLALELVARYCAVPTLRHDERARETEQWTARWKAVLVMPQDRERVEQLSHCMPPGAHAVPLPASRGRRVWAPGALLRRFLDASVDALVRAAWKKECGALTPSNQAPGRKRKWEERWQSALVAADAALLPRNRSEHKLCEDISVWGEQSLRAAEGYPLCVSLEVPAGDGQGFRLRWFVPLPAGRPPLPELASVAECSLALRRAARLFAPLRSALSRHHPDEIPLDDNQAEHFLTYGAERLTRAGFFVSIPPSLQSEGRHRLHLRALLRDSSEEMTRPRGAHDASQAASAVHFEWQAVLDGHVLSPSELASWRESDKLLFRRGQHWGFCDHAGHAELMAQLAKGGGSCSWQAGLLAAFRGRLECGGLNVPADAEGRLRERVQRWKLAAHWESPPPSGFVGELGSLAARGLSWLNELAEQRLGGCLSDELGLDARATVVAFLLARLARAGAHLRTPSLLVVPSFAVADWERAVTEFAPRLLLVRHYGEHRRRRGRAIPREADTVVLTSPRVLESTARLLSRIEWSVVAVAEAHQLCTPNSRASKVLGALRASTRIVVSRASWERHPERLAALVEFANPEVMTGTRRRFACRAPSPSEGSESPSTLRAWVAPFVLRRRRTDQEGDERHKPLWVSCSLSREQARLYESVVDSELERIKSSRGVLRRGRILALVTFLKQVCNHPALYLGESGELDGRSGKLERLLSMLGEVIACNGGALVVTQFREMAERVRSCLQERFGVEARLLTGSSQADVRRIPNSNSPLGRVTVLVGKSVEARAVTCPAIGHVFYFDRPWVYGAEPRNNAPAASECVRPVEHVLVSSGTIEERFEERRLAAPLGWWRQGDANERWIANLSDRELRDWFSLGNACIVDELERG